MFYSQLRFIVLSTIDTSFVNLQEYPYLIVNDGCLIESRREERTLQLLRMLNQFLTKQKVWSRRYNDIILLLCKLVKNPLNSIHHNMKRNSLGCVFHLFLTIFWVNLVCDRDIKIIGTRGLVRVHGH